MALHRLLHPAVRMQAGPEVVQQVISSQLQRILGDQELPAYQARYLEEHSRTSLLHLAAAAEAGALLDPSQRQHSAQLILSGASESTCPRVHVCPSNICLPVSILASDESCCLQAWSQGS
jgi:hypothetical protein